MVHQVHQIHEVHQIDLSYHLKQIHQIYQIYQIHQVHQIRQVHQIHQMEGQVKDKVEAGATVEEGRNRRVRANPMTHQEFTMAGKELFIGEEE